MHKRILMEFEKKIQDIVSDREDYETAVRIAYIQGLDTILEQKYGVPVSELNSILYAVMPPCCFTSIKSMSLNMLSNNYKKYHGQTKTRRVQSKLWSRRMEE